MKTKCYVCKKDKTCGNLKGVDICPKCWKWFIGMLPFCPSKCRKITSSAKRIKGYIDIVRGL